MQSLKYREILHAVAYKLGYDPLDPNFPRDEAVAIGTYIDQWVTRVYPARDWPEWTKVKRFLPDANHIVTWSQISPDTVIPPNFSQSVLTMWRVLAVYIVDPRLVYGANSTKFYLREEGVHCGFEHGVDVWIKYIEPPPRFTSVEWDAITVYQKDEVVYVPTNGNVFRSKTSGNRGHDPSFWFSPAPPPPGGNDTGGASPSPFIATDVLQQKSVSQLGVEAQTQIMQLQVNQIVGSTVPVIDPPAAGSFFTVDVTTTAGVILGNAVSFGDGTVTLADITTDIATQLSVALGGGWTVTPDITNLTVTIENASVFLVSPFYYATALSSAAPLQVIQIQAYVAAVSNATVTPQIIQTTFSADQLISGALYSFTFKDLAGNDHVAQYQSVSSDGQDQIINGIMSSIPNSALSDNYFQNILTKADGTPSIIFTLDDHASLNAEVILPGSPWWEVVPFPLALAEQVIRGAFGDALKDWGQTDKGSMEEQAVPTELEASAQKFTFQPTLPLTGQVAPRSRYRT